MTSYLLRAVVYSLQIRVSTVSRSPRIHGSNTWSSRVLSEKHQNYVEQPAAHDSICFYLRLLPVSPLGRQIWTQAGLHSVFLLISTDQSSVFLSDFQPSKHTSWQTVLHFSLVQPNCYERQNSAYQKDDRKTASPKNLWAGLSLSCSLINCCHLFPISLLPEERPRYHRPHHLWKHIIINSGPGRGTDLTYCVSSRSLYRIFHFSLFYRLLLFHACVWTLPSGQHTVNQAAV